MPSGYPPWRGRCADTGGDVAAVEDRATIATAGHPDVAALRRYLVDEGLLTREAGVYWRNGGWVGV
jgi:hypothetical protein